MANIRFLGTCSGTEPMPGMHQASVLIEVNGQYYFLDAGECCSYTAFLAGVDPLMIRAIFLSHMHIDHTAGLPHLLFCIQKMMSRTKRQLVHENTVHICAPDLSVVGAAIDLFSGRVGKRESLGFRMAQTQTHDGVIYEDENLRVTALHNTHLHEDGSNGWHSYSFLIEVDGKRVVYSGDVGSPAELDPLLVDGCDLLIMETGHHKVVDVCEYAVSRGIRRLRFQHHGREIIADRTAAQERIATYPMDGLIAYDGLLEEI